MYELVTQHGDRNSGDLVSGILSQVGPVTFVIGYGPHGYYLFRFPHPILRIALAGLSCKTMALI
jgi:hypothetical protein